MKQQQAHWNNSKPLQQQQADRHLDEVVVAQLARREDRHQLGEDVQIVLQLVHRRAALREGRRFFFGGGGGGGGGQQGRAISGQALAMQRCCSSCKAASAALGRSAGQGAAPAAAQRRQCAGERTSQRANTEPASQAWGLMAQSLVSPHRLQVKRSCRQWDDGRGQAGAAVEAGQAAHGGP